MSLFQSVTGATARDCVEDSKHNRTIFVVNNGKMGLAIGKQGAHIKTIRKMIGKEIEVVEHNDDPVKFLQKLLDSGNKMISEIKLETRDDGSKQAIVVVDPHKKGIVVGREGRNAEKARLLAKRYFNISSVLINNPEATTMEW
jgi:N utilization substance protein A